MISALGFKTANDFPQNDPKFIEVYYQNLNASNNDHKQMMMLEKDGSGWKLLKIFEIKDQWKTRWHLIKVAIQTIKTNKLKFVFKNPDSSDI